MNFNKFINSDYLKENPLCGIDTYKDELNLTTGECTRRMKKLVLTGNETWYRSSRYTGSMFAYFSQFAGIVKSSPIYCSHLIDIDDISQYQRGTCIVDDISVNLWLFPNSTTPDTFKRYLAAQYANGTPVTVWYVLATPTTEVITVPSGLSGIVEGYLNQSDTPTPTNPIYPTANTVEQWFDIPHYIHKTDTDTITTLPAVLYPTGTTATVGLKGQTVQSGTPTPDNPIMPQSTGDKTANLFDISSVTHQTLGTDGSLVYESAMNLSEFIKVDGNYTVSWSAVRSGAYMRVSTYDENKNFIARIVAQNTYSRSSYSNTHTGYIRINYENSYQLSDIQVNTGSTALPYEPYGYKLDISSGNTTTPVYLGEVETTRKIYKMRLTNPLSATETPYGYRLGFSISSHPAPTYQSGGGRCNITTWNGDYNKIGFVVSNTMAYITQNIAEWATKEGAMAWLDEYEVYIWYVLVTSETAVVNEPLMKIGNYADEVANISIPVTAGGDTISVDTTVQPSEVTVNYEGWHPVQSAHEKSKNLWDNRGFSATAINLNYTHNISNNYGTTLSTTEGNEVTITQSAYPTGNSGYQNGFFTIDVDFSKYAIGDVITISLDYIVNEIHALSTQNATTVYAGKDSNIVPNTLSSGDWKISGRLTATITIIADMRPYVEVRLCGNSITVKNIMLNEGSTALPYEPYWN